MCRRGGRGACHDDDVPTHVHQHARCCSLVEASRGGEEQARPPNWLNCAHTLFLLQSLVSAASKIVQDEGVSGLYAGLSSSLIGVGVSNLLVDSVFLYMEND